MNKRKIILYCLLGISLIFNVLVLSFDTIPYVWPKIKSRYFPEKTISTINRDTEKIIVEKGMQMISSSKSEMIWSEPTGFTQALIRMTHPTSSKEFRLYNYPRAFLFYGLSEYLAVTNDEVNLEKLKHQFDKLIFANNGIPINRIDQVPFGLTALTLYDIYKEDKYLDYAGKLYEYTVASVEADSLISYRRGQEAILNDVLGMTIPFLIRYNDYVRFDVQPLIEKQLTFYIDNGVDGDTYMPAHAVQRENNIKLGSMNWGRGIGWYFIALSHWYKKTGEFEEEYKGLVNTLLQLQQSNNLWGQFPGGGILMHQQQLCSCIQ